MAIGEWHDSRLDRDSINAVRAVEVRAGGPATRSVPKPAESKRQ